MLDHIKGVKSCFRLKVVMLTLKGSRKILGQLT